MCGVYGQPRQLRRSPDGSIETAFALVTGAGEVGRVVSGEGSADSGGGRNEVVVRHGSELIGPASLLVCYGM